ncbi:protein of unknown function, might belng to Transposase [Shewanella benthica]|uniref:Transposase n=1 Tax=Shewanella benthica TaxID=43661 RepID=A0A330M4J1_9GAMM|nr:protein of unknown function, might belng to Transposase [Shewanella benthica]
MLMNNKIYSGLIEVNTKRQYRTYTKEFKEEAIGFITEQGYSVTMH